MKIIDLKIIHDWSPSEPVSKFIDAPMTCDVDVRAVFVSGAASVDIPSHWIRYIGTREDSIKRTKLADGRLR